MRVPKNFALRSSRKGKGVLPPNPKRWEHEHNALDLRYELGLDERARLPVEDAFGLLRSVAGVLPHTQLKIDASTMAHFTGKNARKWSGMCIPLPASEYLVVYNDGHPLTRVRATLMEEFFHLWLDHPPTKMRLLSNGSGARTFDSEVESEAYGSGAAALVPYKALKSMLGEGLSTREVAEHFLVSEQLVVFRERISKITRRRLP